MNHKEAFTCNLIRSIADFTFEPVSKGTRLVFSHYAIPASDLKGITAGWRAFYWTPMKELFEAAN